MDNLKQQLQRQIIANVLIDKCIQSEHLIIEQAWCSQERVIRFTTPFFRKIFPITDNTAGKWKTGDQVMYEVVNDIDSCVVNCIYVPIGSEETPESCFESWDITSSDTNALFDAFDILIDNKIPQFEREAEEKLNALETFLEGEKEKNLSTRYERNRKARAACLAYHGYNCKVCGMSFETTYGVNFKNVIEVHHIVPISQIGKKYVVDPINDLVPVCPNCHVALHCKKNGVYSVEDLKTKINRS